MNARVLVFAKAPVAGRAKTRLIPALGAAGAARLQSALLEDALRRARAAGPAGLELWGTGDDPEGALAAAARRHGAELLEQGDGDLGERMHAALGRATARGIPALILGTDAPGLDARAIRAADALLAERDAVIGPASDGGYVLLGVHRCPWRLFDGIAWGGARVLGATRARMRELGWRHGELDPGWDIDRPEDLERLAALGPGWAALARCADGTAPVPPGHGGS